MSIGGRRLRRWGLAVLSACLLLLAGWFLGVRGWDNLHEVEPGRLYRSAQLTPETLDRVLEEKGIRSILNLRGAHPGSSWYRQELAVARDHGVAYYDRELSALKLVPAKNLEEILACMDQAPKPLLIHCEGGADRTGLVVSAWLFARERLPAAEADRQLSLRYGHFPWLWSHSDAMDRSYWHFVAGHGGTITQAAGPEEDK